jgi:putative phage-type endonuclease
MSLTAAELEERKKGLFATDAAPALGLSKYRSPVQVWMEKTGNPMPFEESEAMKMGLVMQPVIARLYENKYETRLKDLEGVTLWHPKIEFMGSHFDYVTRDNKTLVEIKNFHPARQKEFGEDGSDDVPMDCLVQVVHEAIVFGVTRVDLAVLFGGQSFKVYPITINADTAAMVIEREEKFWRQVVEREAPAPIDPEETRRLFPKDNGQAVMASSEVYHVVKQLAALKGQIKEAEALEDRLLTQIQSAMGEAAVLASPDGDILATWKLAKTSRRVDSDALKAAGLYEQYSKEVAAARRFLLKA